MTIPTTSPAPAPQPDRGPVCVFDAGCRHDDRCRHRGACGALAEDISPDPASASQAPSDITARTDAPAGERIELPGWTGMYNVERLNLLRTREDLLWLCEGGSDGDHAVLVRGWRAMVLHYATHAINCMEPDEHVAEAESDLLAHPGEWEFGANGTASRYFSFEDGHLSFTLVTDAAALAPDPSAAGVAVPDGHALVLGLQEADRLMAAEVALRHQKVGDYNSSRGHARYDQAVYDHILIRNALESAASTPRAALEADADLREEVGYWRRDAAARMWSAQALMQARRKEGRDDLAFAHRDALRAAVSASEAVQSKRWHTPCELCGGPMRPGEATFYEEESGVSGHARCGCEGAKDDTGAPDPTDAYWLARTEQGRAALSADDEDPVTPAQGAGVDLAGVEALVQRLREADRSEVEGLCTAVLDAARALARPAGEIAELIDALVSEATVGGEYNNEAAIHAARATLDAAIAALQRDSAISRRTAGPESGDGVTAELRDDLRQAADALRPFAQLGRLHPDLDDEQPVKLEVKIGRFRLATRAFARISAEDRTSLADGATGGEAK